MRPVSEFHSRRVPRSHMKIEQSGDMRLELICCKSSFKGGGLPQSSDLFLNWGRSNKDCGKGEKQNQTEKCNEVETVWTGGCLANSKTKMRRGNVYIED